MKERKLLQEVLFKKFHDENFNQPKLFNSLVNSLHKIWQFEEDWIEELINDFNFQYKYEPWIRL